MRRWRYGVVVLVLVGIALAQNATLLNGDFSTGDFTDWTVTILGDPDGFDASANVETANNVAVLRGNDGPPDITNPGNFTNFASVDQRFDLPKGSIIACDVRVDNTVDATEVAGSFERCEVDFIIEDPAVPFVAVASGFITIDFLSTQAPPNDWRGQLLYDPPAGAQQIANFDPFAPVATTAGPLSISLNAFPNNPALASATAIHCELDTSQIAGLPDPCVFRLGIRNEDHRTGQDFTIYFDNCEITSTNAAPSFTQPTAPPCNSSFQHSALKALTFTIEAIDPDAGDTVTITASGIPAGATLTPGLPVNGNPASTLFSWTPGAADAGVHVLSFTADDGNGGVATCTFTVDVKFDSDGDGLPDAWEDDGQYVHQNGMTVPLPGADKNVRDVYVKIDYMKNASFDHRPLNSAIDAIKASFLAQGIVLHVDVSPLPISVVPQGGGAAVGFATEIGTVTGTSYNWSGSDAGVVYFDDIKAAHFPAEMGSAFRYCVFAHNLPGSTDSGIARGTFNDFIVSLGSWTAGVGSSDEQAGTFMHELGHTLGLKHGGDDEAKHKPNYLSVMNYSFQTSGLLHSTANPKFDYSRSALNPLDENALDESTGLSPQVGEPSIAGYGTKWWSASDASFLSTSNASSAINWSALFNGPTVAADINKDALPILDATGAILVAAPATLNGFNDWDNLSFTEGNIGTGVTLPAPPTTPAGDELDVETEELIRPDASSRVFALAGKRKILLLWRKAGPILKTRYIVCRSEDGGPFEEVRRTRLLIFLDRHVQQGVEYTYTVKTLDENGVVSFPSAPVTAQLRTHGH